mmetsp:Transcript_25782/g.64993  ORF Transcript_25782/g.64993 Transcript_25782/m.64993 type:complete len:201 (-) Transcript_25782:2122-2724(-)
MSARSLRARFRALRDNSAHDSGSPCNKPSFEQGSVVFAGVLHSSSSADRLPVGDFDGLCAEFPPAGAAPNFLPPAFNCISRISCRFCCFASIRVSDSCSPVGPPNSAPKKSSPSSGITSSSFCFAPARVGGSKLSKPAALGAPYDRVFIFDDKSAASSVPGFILQFIFPLWLSPKTPLEAIIVFPPPGSCSGRSTFISFL